MKLRENLTNAEKLKLLDEVGFGKDPPKSLTINAADVVTRPVPWLIENFLVRGALNGIQGIMGMGKSWLVGGLVKAVADGGEWLNDYSEMITVQRGRVLIGNFDDDVSYTTVPRLKNCKISESGLKNVELLDRSVCEGLDFSDERLDGIFAKHKPDLAIFDTLQHFIGIGTDMNRANEVNGMLINIQRLAEKYNTAVLILEHIGKQAANGNGGHSVNWGLGSVAIAGLFRTLWTIGELSSEEFEQGTRAIVCSKGNLIKYKPPARLFKICDESGGIVWIGIDENVTAFDLISSERKKERGRPAEQSDNAQTVIKELLKHGEMKSAELEKALTRKGVSPATYKRARESIGVKSVKRNNIWYSYLQEYQNSEDDYVQSNFENS